MRSVKEHKIYFITGFVLIIISFPFIVLLVFSHYKTVPIQVAFITGLIVGLATSLISWITQSTWSYLNNRKKRTNITVDIEGTQISIDNLTQEEADNLAERFQSLHPKVSNKQ